jgi:glutathione S-transferase
VSAPPEGGPDLPHAGTSPREPAPDLELYQFEGCPFCERVREVLDDLGLDYIVRTVSRAHPQRDRVLAVSGQTQVPVLVDHARGEVLVESEDITAYLHRIYRRGS